MQRDEVQIALNNAALLLSQANGILGAVIERGWDRMEGDLVAISAQVRAARQHVSTGYFKTHAACGLFIPRDERE